MCKMITSLTEMRTTDSELVSAIFFCSILRCRRNTRKEDRVEDPKEEMDGTGNDSLKDRRMVLSRFT